MRTGRIAMMTQGLADHSVSYFEILGVHISSINMEMACEIIQDSIEKREKGYVCVCPVSTIMACQDDPEVLHIVNSATLATPDGMPTVWIARRKGLKHVERVYGPDLMLALCELSQKKGYSHYFYGSTPEVLAKLKENLKARFPGLNVCGSYAPPFRRLTEKEDNEIVNEINLNSPDIIWVGLGSPKQDIWISRHREGLNAPIILAVGAAFDFVSGAKRQAPRWMQRSGLEWAFRLGSEPGRLWRRYVIGNTRFLYLLLKDYVGSK